MRKKENKEGFFERILNRILKLKFLKIFEISVGFVKGVALKVEFFEQKGKDDAK